jgi:hypothetical protein
MIRVLFFQHGTAYKIIQALPSLVITISKQRAGIAQSVQRLATGWTTEGSEFESWYGQQFSLLHVIQTGSRFRQTSYPMGTGGSFLGGKAAGA